MKLGLTGKGVFVTGGSGGIGRAIVAAFAAEGARVHFTYKTNVAAAQDLAENLELPAPIEMDLADETSVVAAFAAGEAGGPVDILVNNAVLWRAPDAENPASVLFRANIEGPLQLTTLAARRMAERGWGRVVTVSSNIAEDGMAGSAYYSTAKAALHGMAASLQWDYGRNGVLLNTVLPGLTLTDRARSFLPEEVREGERSKTPTGALSAPEDVAQLVVFLASSANANITGECIRVSGGR